VGGVLFFSTIMSLSWIQRITDYIEIYIYRREKRENRERRDKREKIEKREQRERRERNREIEREGGRKRE
jgi:hypothetical protein